MPSGPDVDSGLNDVLIEAFNTATVSNSVIKKADG